MTKQGSLDEFVKNKLGKDALTSLTKQDIGGNNNEKGNHHEQLFAIYKLAKFYLHAQNDEEIEISSQDKAFVDDLIIFNKTQNKKRSYQLKDSKAVYWHKSKGISPYFSRQYLIDTKYYNVANAKTILVLANEDIFRLRCSDIPRSIKNHTECMHFQNVSLNIMLMEDSNFKNAMGGLCCFPQDIDKLSAVATILMGVWASRNKEDTNDRNVFRLVEKAKKLAAPDYFKNQEDEQIQLDLEVAAILDNITGFSYQISEGFLVYDFRSFHGTVKSRIGTIGFNDFCKVLKNERPEDARSLLQVLMGSGDEA